MLSIEILDYNGQFRLSYSFEREITRPVEEYAGMSLRWAVDSGLIHKDEANFCRMRIRWKAAGNGDAAAS